MLVGVFGDMEIEVRFSEIIEELFSIANNSQVYNGQSSLESYKTTEKMTLGFWKFVYQNLNIVTTVGDIKELIRNFECYLIKKFHIPLLGKMRSQNHRMIIMRWDYYGKLFREDNYCYKDILSFLAQRLTTIERERFYGLNFEPCPSSRIYNFDSKIKEEASDFIDKLGDVLADEKLKKTIPVSNIKPIPVITQDDYDRLFADDKEMEENYTDFFEGTKFDVVSNLDPISPGPDLTPDKGYFFDWYKWEVITPKYKRARVNNHTIEYWSGRRKYRVDKVWVPSVSDLLDKYYPFKKGSSYYNNLRREATQTVNRMRKAILEYEEEGIDCNLPELEKYKELKSEYKFSPIGTGLMVAYCKGKIPLYAGTIDMLLQNSNSTYNLLSFNRVSNANLARDSIQLNLYRVALEECSNRDVAKMEYIQIKDSFGYFSNVKKEENNTKVVLEKRYREYCEKYKEWEIAKKNPTTEYKISKFKPKDTVLFDGRKGIIKDVDYENGIVEVHILQCEVVVRMTIEYAYAKEMRIVTFH